VAKGRVYTPYKRIVSELGLMQLDVYRIVDPKDKIVKDVLRIYSPSANKVILVDLGAPRESLSLLDFLNKLTEALKSNNIPVPERTLKRLQQELAKKEKAAA